MPQDKQDIARDDVLALKQAYLNLPFYKRMFFPGNVSEVLRAYGADSPMSDTVTVYDRFLNNTWLFQRLFFNCLLHFAQRPVLQCMEVLSEKRPEEDKKTWDNYLNQAVGCANHTPLAKAMMKLSHTDILSGNQGPSYYTKLVTHRQLEHIPDLLEPAIEAGLLSGPEREANFTLLIKHLSPSYLGPALNILYQRGVFEGAEAQKQFERVVNLIPAKNLFHCLQFFEETSVFKGPKGLARMQDLLTHNSIFFSEDVDALWSQIPYYSAVTTEVFDAMVKIAEEHRNNPAEGQRALTEYIQSELIDSPLSDEDEEEAPAPLPSIRSTREEKPLRVSDKSLFSHPQAAPDAESESPEDAANKKQTTAP